MKKQAIKGRKTDAILLRHRLRVPGYILGLRQPCVMFRLQTGAAPSAQALSVFDKLVRQRYGGDHPSQPPHSKFPMAIEHLLQWVRILLKENNHAIFDDAKVWQNKNHARNEWSIAQPCGSFPACIAAIDLSIDLVNLAGGRCGHDANEVLKKEFDSMVDQLSGRLRYGNMRGFNSIHFLNAANELCVPWSDLGNNVFQLGQGASARVLDSSFTDSTSVISVRIARNKPLAAKIMRDAGLPIQPHQMVTSKEEAVRIANSFGYPAVVKPADRDGGVGVTALLHNARAVAEAFEKARIHSDKILVEKHFFGLDYRIQVVNGKVHGVLEREPAGVTGDGSRSIRQLVFDQNNERASATDDRRYLQAIKADEEADSLLKASGLKWESVPAMGQIIRLRGAANVASGGVPRPVSIEKVHPDNLELALRAVRILRLDVAGVDLLIPNIYDSWLETGATICEVNAQPQMFTTMHLPMLKSLLGGTNGRIPIVLIFSETPQHPVCAEIFQKMQALWPNVARIVDGGAFIAEKQVTPKDGEMFQNCRSLLRDPKTQALVLSCSSTADISVGWPFDQIDVLVLAGEAGHTAAHLTELAASAAWLKPTSVIVDGTSKACSAAQKAFPDNALTVISEGAHDALVKQIAASSIKHLLRSHGKPQA